MKTCTCLAVGLLATILAAGVVAEDPKPDEEPSFWMKKKMEYSEQILNGLAKEDYELIAKNARSMKA